jgi:hypothetical protein
MADWRRPEGTPDFREARCPTRVYQGACKGDIFSVTVLDSALGQDQANPRSLEPEASREVRDCSPLFCWGDAGDGSRQLALALLLDVSGDAATALRWFELFAEKYVRRLAPSWSVPELDIALWLHCFENAPPGA